MGTINFLAPRRLRRWHAARLPALLLLTTGTLVAFSAGAHAQAGPTVLPGFDLFQTDPAASSFVFPVAGPTPLMGVPIGTFDFGGLIGVQNVGNTDTIIQRLSTANAPSQTIDTQMLKLDMETVHPIDIGAGLHNYFITLNTEDGGSSVSTGTLTINFNSPTNTGGTFNSFFDVFFDIHQDALNGPMVITDSELTLNGTGNAWSHTPPAGATLIDGVNSNLNGNNHDGDFFPVPPIQEAHPGQGVHEVVETGVSFPDVAPEPGSLALTAFGLLGGLTPLLRRRRRPA